MSVNVLPMFSSSFMVLCLIFKYLNYFEYIFVYVVRESSNFVDLHVAVLLSQHHWGRDYLFPLYILPSLVKD